MHDNVFQKPSKFGSAYFAYIFIKMLVIFVCFAIVLNQSLTAHCASKFF